MQGVPGERVALPPGLNGLCPCAHISSVVSSPPHLGGGETYCKVSSLWDRDLWPVGVSTSLYSGDHVRILAGVSRLLMCGGDGSPCVFHALPLPAFPPLVVTALR